MAKRYDDNLKIRKTVKGRRYYGTVLPSEVTVPKVYEYTARLGDRWDTLAWKYLGSPTRWYEIAKLNESANGSMFIKQGTVIKLPRK